MASTPTSSNYERTDGVDPELGEHAKGMIKAILTYANGKEWVIKSNLAYLADNPHFAPGSPASATEVRYAQNLCRSYLQDAIARGTMGRSPEDRRHVLAHAAALVTSAARSEVQKTPSKKLSKPAFKLMEWLLNFTHDKELEAFYDAQTALQQQKELEWAQRASTAAPSSPQPATASSVRGTLPPVTESPTKQESFLTGDPGMQGDVSSDGSVPQEMAPGFEPTDMQPSLASPMRTLATSPSEKCGTAVVSIYPKALSLEEAVRKGIRKKGFPDLS
jgi:hypothetical protein